GAVATTFLVAELRQEMRVILSTVLKRENSPATAVGQSGILVKLGISQYYKIKRGRSTVNDEVINKLVKQLNRGKSYLGVLPIINPEVIQLGLRLATALEMKISPTIFFDRKIYNYFDLPKGYQITQQELPFATLGYLPVIKGNKVEKIPIEVLQLEEDTAKSTYNEEGVRLDFNRAGNPLIELVTAPVFQQVETVLIFIKQLQNLLRYLDISEAKMERGQLRVDLNFSLQLGKNYSTPRYEIKNLNSLANVEKAIKYETNKH
ncbi:10878_t:CDS:2, partial [Ambispora gerdemannii]